MHNDLRYSLKEYLITQSVNKHHYPFKYWIKNKNLFIHLVFWVWVIWAFLTLFAIFLPVSNEQKLGRGAIIVFETVFQYIVRILGSSHSAAPTDVADSVNISPPLWNYEAYLFLYLTVIVILIGFYCVYLIRNFLEDLNIILKKHSQSKFIRIKFFLFLKLAKFFWLCYLVLTIWTAFALLYIKKPSGDDVSSWMYAARSIEQSDGSRVYFRELTPSGWITAGFNVFAAAITIFFYGKYCREIFKGNPFFFSDLRPQEEKSPSIFIDQGINKEISSSLNISSNLDYEKANSPGYIVELSNVNKYFRVKEGIFHALKNINLSIEKGDFVVILGYSGSGKTTLLNLLAGIDRPTNGSSVIADCDTTKMSDYALNFFRRKKIGYIFQNYALLPNLTASENVSIAQGMDKPPFRELIKLFYSDYKNSKDSKEKKSVCIRYLKDMFSFRGNKEELYEILDTLNLMEHKDKYPHTLSGGQQQRVAIARALIKKPDILLADEPTGAIDHAMTKSILTLFHNINKHLKTTVILITHNPLIAKMARRVLYVSDGEIIKDERNTYPQHPNDIKGL